MEEQGRLCNRQRGSRRCYNKRREGKCFELNGGVCPMICQIRGKLFIPRNEVHVIFPYFVSNGGFDDCAKVHQIDING